MIIKIEDLQNTNKQRLLGIDVGEKTLGLALSDILWTIASPYTTLKRSWSIEKDVEILLNIVQKENIKAFIIGYPLNMNGSEGPSCKRVMDLCAKLDHFAILLWDERLSTVAVQRTMLEADLSRKKRSQHVDKMAAAYILQGAMDRLKNITR